MARLVKEDISNNGRALPDSSPEEFDEREAAQAIHLKMEAEQEKIKKKRHKATGGKIPATCSVCGHSTGKFIDTAKEDRHVQFCDNCTNLKHGRESEIVQRHRTEYEMKQGELGEDALARKNRTCPSCGYDIYEGGPTGIICTCDYGKQNIKKRCKACGANPCKCKQIRARAAERKKTLKSIYDLKRELSNKKGGSK